MTHPFTNYLITESSPYLLQHAHNPVDWYPWGDIALQKAKELGRPILVSIGYSACHWCHVMEKESFENEDTAKVMNQYFINIKIDREERPDLDHIYMDAVQAMAGSGGWPLNVFLTPEGKPFYGGTYFPPVKAFNRSSWKEVLYGVAEAWRDRRHEIESQADNLTDYLQKSNSIGQRTKTASFTIDQPDSKEQCHTIFQNIMNNADKQWGGFGKAPKFPQFFVIQYLLQYYHFTKNNEAFDQAILAIDKMLQGGIYDQIGGGMARYSTDIEWLAPHFEKMLYDNALLINVLCDAYQITRKKQYADAIKKTISFIEREMMHKEGGFYSALDADSEGIEGKYYVWSKAAIEHILGERAELFCEYYDVSPEGNWEDSNILRIRKPIDAFAADKGLDIDAFTNELEVGLQQLQAERDKRIRPATDDKIILSWNCLLLTALCKSSAALQEDSYKKTAERHFDFILSAFRKETTGVMLHTYKEGVAKYPAFLDDYSYFIEACLHLYELTYDASYLKEAKDCCNYVLLNFSGDDSCLFYFTHKEQTDIVVRKKEVYDGATPSGNAVMASNLFKLSIIYDMIEWRQLAINMLATMLPMVVKYPSSFGLWSIFFMQQTEGMNEIAVIGPGYRTACKEISSYFIPNKIMMGAQKASDDFPLLQNKTLANNLLIYLCKNYSCLSPDNTVQNLLKRVLSPTIV
jgi:uncharacterized protein YyaL (SSP411 family)